MIHMKKQLRFLFAEKFGGEELPRAFFAGGRVNLIGEHTDYNGGHVFPCALTMGTWCLLRLRRDRQLRFFSANFSEWGILYGSLDELAYAKKAGWSNYCAGMLWTMAQRGIFIPLGFDMLVWGNIPSGAGLSSSASLEMAMGEALRQVYGLEFSNTTMALLGQQTENDFIGLRCGIMDQFAIAMGRKNCGIYLDTSSLSYRYCPVELGEYGILIMNTMKRRGLTGSKYNERRSQCEHALQQLQQKLSIRTLGELDEASFEANCTLITDPAERRRARHAVYENRRTMAAVEALEHRNLPAFGALMDESHRSLRDEYEVSCPELDTLVEAACSQKGVLGARMTGGGFGGCAIALVCRNRMEQVIRSVQETYTNAIGHGAEFYPASVGGGPKEIFFGAVENKIH